MTNKKPLLMNKELYNLLYDGGKTKISKPKETPKDTPEKMFKALVGVFCKGRYQSWIAFQNIPHPRNLKKSKERK